MVNYMAYRIEQGKKTLDDVSPKYYDAVKAKLIEDGYLTEE